MLYVLDSDMLTLFRQGHPEVCRRVAAHDSDEIATSVITVEEYLTGWYSLIRQSRHPEQRELAYAELADAPHFLSRLHIAKFTLAAMDRFDKLRKQKLNVGGMDLRIAAIVLETNAILVTRNKRDFGRVDGLAIEDWSVPVSETD